MDPSSDSGMSTKTAPMLLRTPGFIVQEPYETVQGLVGSFDAVEFLQRLAVRRGVKIHPERKVRPTVGPLVEGNRHVNYPALLAPSRLAAVGHSVK